MSLNFSLINENQDSFFNNTKNILEEKRNKLKKQNKTKKKIDINDFYNSHETTFDENEDGNALSDFVPLDNKPESIGNENAKNKEILLTNQTREESVEKNDIVTSDIYNNLESSYQNTYYNDSHLSQYNNNNNNNQSFNSELLSDNALLLKKINYMIALLEKQQDERTDKTGEEVILYIFLGVFIIFVLDSFAKVGKYVR